MKKNTLICMLLLIPMLSARAGTTTDTLGYETVAESPTLPKETDNEVVQVRTKGFLDTYHAVRTQGHADWMASRTRARGELTLRKGAASVFLSLNATYNSLLKERTGLELREAYIAYGKGNLDLQAGRQIIVWGVADALRLTDCVSPFDYTEFLAQDYDDIRMPVNALRAKYTCGRATFEAVCIPVSSFFTLPTDEHNPWAVRLPSLTMPYVVDLESGKPEKKLRNIELGGRITANLKGIDFSLSVLRTWNKMPALGLSLSEGGETLLATGQYRRMTMLGADCSIPVGQFVIRTETAFYMGEAQGATLGHEVARRNALNTLVGADWFPGHDWNISAQYCHKYISGNLHGLSARRNSGLATARLSKELLRNTLKLSTFAYVDIANGGIFNRFSSAYSLNDQIELTVGYDFFHARKGMFAMYNDNSEVWMKAKYSF